MKSIIFEILYQQYGASLQFSLPTHPFLSGTKTGRWKFLEGPIFEFCRHNPGSILMESDRSLTEGFQHWICQQQEQWEKLIFTENLLSVNATMLGTLHIFSPFNTHKN